MFGHDPTPGSPGTDGLTKCCPISILAIALVDVMAVAGVLLLVLRGYAWWDALLYVVSVAAAAVIVHFSAAEQRASW